MRVLTLGISQIGSVLGVFELESEVYCRDQAALLLCIITHIPEGAESESGSRVLWFRVFDMFDEGVGMLKRFLFAALYSF